MQQFANELRPSQLMRLGLLRHGVAHDAGPETEFRDEPRELTDEGRRRMEVTATGIARLDLAFQAVVCSPLVRCVQTAEIVGGVLGVQPRVAQTLRPGLHVHGLINVLLEYPEAEAVLVCGHQPDMSTVAADLVGGGWIEFKKGALALIELPVLREHAGHLVALYPPSALRRLGA